VCEEVARERVFMWIAWVVTFFLTYAQVSSIEYRVLIENSESEGVVHGFDDDELAHSSYFHHVIQHQIPTRESGRIEVFLAGLGDAY